MFTITIIEHDVKLFWHSGDGQIVIFNIKNEDKFVSMSY